MSFNHIGSERTSALAVEEPRVVAVHPELTSNVRVHRMFPSKLS